MTTWLPSLVICFASCVSPVTIIHAKLVTNKSAKLTSDACEKMSIYLILNVQNVDIFMLSGLFYLNKLKIISDKNINNSNQIKTNGAKLIIF